MTIFFRSNETETERKRRLANDNEAQKARYANLSPNAKKLRNQRRTQNRRNAKTKIKSVKKNPDFIEKIAPIDESGSKFEKNVQIIMAPIVEEPKLSKYEQIRQRNIEEQENLFQKMKISELKAQAAVGSSKNKSSKKH